MLKVSPFADVLDDFSRGKMIILVDDQDRENEGDLTLASEFVTPEALSFMMNFGRGLICITISEKVAQNLSLPLQALNNNSSFQTQFAVSVDHASVLGSGASAIARSLTMQKMIEADARAEDFCSPGHVFPLIANPAGVLGRLGQTEGSYDLARLAGVHPSGVICEILNSDGSVAKGEQLNEFALAHGLKIGSVEQIVQYRLSKEVLIREVARNKLQTAYAEFETYIFRDDAEGKEHIALVYGDLSGKEPVLVRIHSECLTGDVFGSRRCDCGVQLDLAMRQIIDEGRGCILYLRQEGRGIGLANKIRSYALQDTGLDTVEANIHLGFKPDLRDYSAAANILRMLNVKSIRLLTNNPKKLEALSELGFGDLKREAVIAASDPYSLNYLNAKKEKLGHLL